MQGLSADLKLAAAEGGHFLRYIRSPKFRHQYLIRDYFNLFNLRNVKRKKTYKNYWYKNLCDRIHAEENLPSEATIFQSVLRLSIQEAEIIITPTDF